MARTGSGFTLSTSVDRADFRALMGALSSLDKDTQNAVRDVSTLIGGDLLRELREHAAHAPTPAANLVASAARVKRDRIVNVEVGGSRKVGRAYRSTSRNASGRRSTRKVRASAGTLLWGTEQGSKSGTDRSGRAYTDRFGAPRLPHTDESGYWVAPAMRASLPRARDRWVLETVRIIKAAGLVVTYGR